MSVSTSDVAEHEGRRTTRATSTVSSFEPRQRVDAETGELREHEKAFGRTGL